MFNQSWPQIRKSLKLNLESSNEDCHIIFFDFLKDSDQENEIYSGFYHTNDIIPKNFQPKLVIALKLGKIALMR